MNDHLGQLLDSTRALLLDFDGPICHPFAGYPAPDIADDLRAYLQEHVSAVPRNLHGSDPLELFRRVARTFPDLKEPVEDRLTDAERKAVQTARPTPYAHDLITTVASSGVPVAIVSNNSAAAIGDYFHQHGLTDEIAAVIGRPYGHPNLMKPNPHMLAQAMNTLNAQPHETTFVGDSLSDLEAARRAHTRSIGYAKDPTRVAGLTVAGADAVVESIGDLVTRWNTHA